jgi:hypothetical protein
LAKYNEQKLKPFTYKESDTNAEPARGHIGKVGREQIHFAAPQDDMMEAYRCSQHEFFEKLLAFPGGRRQRHRELIEGK